MKERTPPTRQQKLLALVDFWAFVDLIGLQGGSSRFYKCHRDMISWSQDEAKRRKLILMPRGHLKSTLCTVADVLWSIYINPNIRCYVGTATKELASAFIREIKTYLEDDFLQEHVWNNRPHISGRLIPAMDRSGKSRRTRDETSYDYSESEASDKKVVWRVDAIQVLRDRVLKEPTVTAGSVGSVATGFHYDKLYLDDVVTFDNVASTSKLDRVMSWINDMSSVLDDVRPDPELEQILTDIIIHLPPKVRPEAKTILSRHWNVGGCISAVGTRYHKHDYYAFLQENCEDLEFSIYSRNIYVNGMDNTDGYLWPENFSEAKERRLRAELTSQRFASQYLNSILSKENQDLLFENVQVLDNETIEFTPNTDRVTLNLPGRGKSEMKLFCVVDPAISTSDSADYTAIAVGGVAPSNDLVVLEVKMGRWRVNEWSAVLWGLSEKYNFTAVHIESVAAQSVLFQVLRETELFRSKPLGLIPYRPTNTMRKSDRIKQNLGPLFQNSMIWMMPSVYRDKNLEDQIRFLDAVGIKDDGVDAISMLKEVAKPSIQKKQQPTHKVPRRPGRYGGYY